jgi:hypothetical protein
MFEILFKTNDVLDDPLRKTNPYLPVCGCLDPLVGGNYAHAEANGMQE